MNEISRERVNESVKRIAKVVNINECVIEELGCACEMEEWNDDVVYQLKEAQTLLGQALATLVNWFDNAEESEGSGSND